MEGPHMPHDTDAARIRRLTALHTALICDVLDKLGHREAFLGLGIGSLFPAGVVAGRAFTISAEPVDRPSPDGPYQGVFDAFTDMEDRSWSSPPMVNITPASGASS